MSIDLKLRTSRLWNLRGTKDDPSLRLQVAMGRARAVQYAQRSQIR